MHHVLIEYILKYSFPFQQRKERLVEEVRRHFGYTVDPKDEKFQMLLEKKEKEQKKLLKEAKRKAREEKVLEKLKTKNVKVKKENSDIETQEEPPKD